MPESFAHNIWCQSNYTALGARRLFRLWLRWYSHWFICEVKRRGQTCLSADDFLCKSCFVDTLPFSKLISQSAGWPASLSVTVCVCVWMAASHWARWMEECIANQNNQSLFSLFLMLCSLLCRMQRADPQHATEQGLSPQGSASPIYCLFFSPPLPCERACSGIGSIRIEL